MKREKSVNMVWRESFVRPILQKNHWWNPHIHLLHTTITPALVLHASLQYFFFKCECYSREAITVSFVCLVRTFSLSRLCIRNFREENRGSRPRQHPSPSPGHKFHFLELITKSGVLPSPCGLCFHSRVMVMCYDRFSQTHKLCLH